MDTIDLKRIFHRGKECIGLYFYNNPSLNNLVQKLTGVKWSQTNKCWYIPREPGWYNELKVLTKGKVTLTGSGLEDDKESASISNIVVRRSINKSISKVSTPLVEQQLSNVNQVALQQFIQQLQLNSSKIITCKYCFPLKVAYNCGNIMLAERLKDLKRMATKLIIKEGYNGDPIGETIMNPDLTVTDVLNKLPNEIMLSLSDEKQLKYLEEVDIRDDEISLSIIIDKYNLFECFCILEKLCDEFAKLGKKYNKEVLINDYKRRAEDVIFFEVDSTIPYCVLSIPTEKGKNLGELFEIALFVENIVSKVVKTALEFSKDVKSYPKPANPYITTKTKLFISHSSKDKPIVKKIVADLKSKKFDVWYDEENILVGQDFVEQIENGIRESDFLVLVMSKNFIDYGPWAKEEYRIALTEQISKNITKILPLLVEDCNVPDFLKTKHYADFREDYDYGLNKLINSANKLTKKK